MASYEEKVGLPPMQFGGLNTRLREAYHEGDFAASIRNVDLRPYGSLKKRQGLTQMTDGTNPDPDGDGNPTNDQEPTTVDLCVTS